MWSKCFVQFCSVKHLTQYFSLEPSILPLPLPPNRNTSVSVAADRKLLVRLIYFLKFPSDVSLLLTHPASSLYHHISTQLPRCLTQGAVIFMLYLRAHVRTHTVSS